MQRLIIALALLMLVAPAAFAQPLGGWGEPWSVPGGSPRLGVLVNELSFQELDGLALPYGVEVTRVLPGGPAEGGGLRTGDILVEFDGQPLYSVARLQWLTRKAAADTPVQLNYYREGKALKTELGIKRARVGLFFRECIED